MGNNPVKYVDPDGNSFLGALCYVGAVLVLAAGTTVSVLSGGTLVAVEPAAVKASLALAATGVAIDASASLANQNKKSSSISLAQSKSKGNASQKSEEKSGDIDKPKELKKPKSGTGKEKSSDIPSWAEGKAPYTDESGKDFAKRLMDKKYGEGQYDTGPGSEYNKLKKWGDRGFE